MLDIKVPVLKNEKLKYLQDLIKDDGEIETLLRASNITAVDRMGITDHGPVHIKIVANFAIKILRILIKHGVVPSIVKNYGMGNDDAEVVVFLASVLHDVGHAIHRMDHELLSTIVAGPIIDRLISALYDDEKREIVKMEILHCIYSHRSDILPLTVEGGIVKIADALDMAQGRARIPFSAGKISIHSVSAMAIEWVKVMDGEKKPVKIKIKMKNSAGIFQIDELLKNKIQTSGIKDYFEVFAEVVGEEEKILTKEFTIP